MHVPLGLLNGWLVVDDAASGFAMIVGFLAYEIMQDWRIKDKSYWDVLGWLVGLVAIFSGYQIYKGVIYAIT